MGGGRDQLTVFFDAACGICSGLRERLARIDVEKRVRWVPLQTPGALEAAGISPEAAADEVWAIRRGEKLHGAGVAAAVLDQLSPLPVFERAYGVGPLRWVADRAYRWVSERRGRISAACRIPSQIPAGSSPQFW
jgi:predicted DCC family thiol-disulfide oxidoreductase YuxK